MKKTDKNVSTPGSPSDAVVAAYEATQAALAAETVTCRYCKAAKTRTGDSEKWCKRHAERRRLNFVCSPVSEAYWSS